MSHFLLLLWIFAKSTFTSFAGLASLPEIREELVAQRHWITDMAHCAILGRADGTAEVLYRPGARGADPMDIVELMRNQDA